MRYIVTISHAHPPQFLYGIVSDIKGPTDEQPTYYEALQLIATGEHEQVLEDMFILGNVDEPEMLPDRLSHLAQEVRQYRRMGNRSLSVGDIVILTPVDSSEHASSWMCAPIGWKRMDHIPEVVPTSFDDSSSAARRAHTHD